VIFNHEGISIKAQVGFEKYCALQEQHRKVLDVKISTAASMLPYEYPTSIFPHTIQQATVHEFSCNLYFWNL